MCNNVFGIGNRCVKNRCVIYGCVSLIFTDSVEKKLKWGAVTRVPQGWEWRCGSGKMGMGHLGHFDETHRTGSTQDGLHADAAHASLPTLCRILLLTQTRPFGEVSLITAARAAMELQPYCGAKRVLRISFSHQELPDAAIKELERSSGNNVRASDEVCLHGDILHTNTNTSHRVLKQVSIFMLTSIHRFMYLIQVRWMSSSKVWTNGFHSR